MTAATAQPHLMLIDNYDSFTWNLWHYLGQLGADVVVHRNDQITVDAVMESGIDGIVISPGPCDPDRAGICLDLIARAADEEMPLFGVCLGHQAIGQAFGGTIERSPVPMHGKVSDVSHDGSGVFRQLPDHFHATRYHSLTIAPGSVPECLAVNARSDDGVIMGVRHRSLPMHGVQFHPESIETEHGHALLRNFLAEIEVRRRP